MKSEKGRQVASFHLDVDPGVDGVTSVLNTVAHLVVERVGAGVDLVITENDTLWFGFIDAQIATSPEGKQCLCLLALAADKEGVEPALFDTKRRTLRLIEKGEDDGTASTAHVVLAIEPRNFNGRSHAGLIEVAGNVGRARLKSALNRTLKAVARDGELRAKNPRSGNEVLVKPSVKMDLVTNDKLAAEAKSGRIKSLKLYDRSVDTSAFDPPAGVEPRRREMVLKAAPLAGESFVDLLNRVKVWATGQGFQDMYVEWERDHESPHEEQALGLTDSARIDLKIEDVGELMFAKRRYVKLDAKLAEAHESLHDAMLTAMLSFIDED